MTQLYLNITKLNSHFLKNSFASQKLIFWFLNASILLIFESAEIKKCLVTKILL